MFASDDIKQLVHDFIRCLRHKAQTIDVVTEFDRLANPAFAGAIDALLHQVARFLI
jgi:hypothetical protein